MGFSVESDGDIAVAPTTFLARKGDHDIIIWMIGNKGQGSIKVTLTDFMYKPNSDDEKGTVPIVPEPFIWLGSNSATIAGEAVGIIAARLNPEYEFQSHGLFKHDHVSYTIETRSSEVPPLFVGFDIDPDGEIKP
jgi:hypothetical protein